MPERTIATLPLPTDPAPEPPDNKTLQKRKWQDRGAFGEDLWGVSAKHTGAEIDVEKLRAIGLPIFYTESDLADWLGISLKRLRCYSFDRAADASWHYTRTVVPKRSGGERIILAPKRELKALQRKVLEGIVTPIPVSSAAHGFVKGRSTFTNAQAHAGRGVILKLDLKDFFPSITFARVRGFFLMVGYPFAVAAALALLCTEYDREPFTYNGKNVWVSIGPRHLVQGAPTSPALANLIAWRLDRRLEGLAATRNFTYTRYADDLTFSGDDDGALATLRVVSQKIIRDEHFTPNEKKTHIARRSTRQLVTGLVVNEQPAIPRKARRQLRAILHNAEKTGLAAQNRTQRPKFAAHLRGRIAYINAANSTHAARLRDVLDRLEQLG